MTSHEIANLLLEYPDMELLCLGNTEEFNVEEVGNWNDEFIYLAKHHVDID